MGIVGRLSGQTGTIALDRLRQNNSRLPLVGHRFGIGCVNLKGVVTTAIKIHNVFIAQVFYQFEQLRVFTKKVLASVSATIGLIILQLAITDLVHAFLQQASGVLF